MLAWCLTPLILASPQGAEAGTNERSKSAWTTQSHPVSKDKQKRGQKGYLTAKPKFDLPDLDGEKEPTLMS